MNCPAQRDTPKTKLGPLAEMARGLSFFKTTTSCLFIDASSAVTLWLTNGDSKGALSQPASDRASTFLALHTGHVRAERLGDLYGKRTHASRRAVGSRPFALAESVL